MCKQYLAFLTISCMLLTTSDALSKDNDQFPGVESLMTAEEREQTGVSKLTSGEIKALNAWLVRYTAEDAPVLTKNNEEVKQQVVKAANEGSRSRIKGHFTGWTGETRFYLENGEIWKQRYGAKWKISLENPEVIIKKGFMGTYTLTIVSENKTTGVSQVKQR
ncbi:MAG: hypothetical protein ABGY96_06530 [bacterium]